MRRAACETSLKRHSRRHWNDTRARASASSALPRASPSTPMATSTSPTPATTGSRSSRSR